MRGENVGCGRVVIGFRVVQKGSIAQTLRIKPQVETEILLNNRVRSRDVGGACKIGPRACIVTKCCKIISRISGVIVCLIMP